MATDTLTKQAAFPCAPATTAQLDEMLQEIYDDHDVDPKRFVSRTDSDEILWEKVRHLRIISSAAEWLNSLFSDHGFSNGFYPNADGSWLLIMTDIPHPEDYVKHCGAELESLWIIAAAMSTVPGLENLSQLTALNLAECNSLTELPGLEHLTQLTSLRLSECESLKELPGLENLKLLTSLNLFGCKSLTELPGLEDLKLLTSLKLGRCKSLTKLPGLENLTQLTSLDLSQCYSLTELPGLGNLKLLTSLDLRSCESLTELPGLENLTKFTSLELSGCYSLTELPGLGNLTQLISLNLSWCYSLKELPGLENLSNLTSLDLRACRSLKELPGLGNLTQLTSLELAWCRSLTDLPECIRPLTSLRKLGLSFLTLRDLPDWLPEIAEDFDRRWSAEKTGRTKAIVYLYGTTVDAIPDMSIFDQPYEVVAEWFEKRKLGQTHPLNEIKVVFLGDGEAGKSHTIARLMNDGGKPVGYVDSSTPGIVIRHKEYDLNGRKITVHYWDFGGQEIMHSMHRIFLTGRTMYVVLLNARDDTQGDRARYWLHNIKSFAPGAPVLLVLNKIDQNENASVNENDLRSRYEELTQIVRLSALRDTQEKFNDRFTSVLLKEIEKTGFLDAQWPNTWTQVKERLEKMERHYIMGDAYEDICRECQVDENQENLLHWFNDLGVSFCCRDAGDYALKDYVILRPDWITNALYIILFNPLEKASNGLIPHRSIFEILQTAHKNSAVRCTLPNARYSSGDIQYVLGIMRKFSLSFPHGTGHEFIPMLCQQNSMVNVQDYHKDEDTLEFNMDFDYLPNNLLHRLMVERHAELDMSTVWRTGARFHLPELGLSAVVVIDGNTLRFFIRGTDPMHRPNTYLTMLKAHVERIVEKMGLKPPTCQLIYKLDDRQDAFDYEMLKAMQEAGQTQAFSMTWRKMLPIVDILNQSAPDGLEDEMKLLDAIRRSCQNIQGEPDYCLNGDGHGMEDKRNRRIRDDLFGWGYNIQDQSQRGFSGSGNGIGELDFLLHNEKRALWTAIEALRVSDGKTAEWKNHLNKLIGNYNFFGAKFLYLLTYVDADPKAYERIWKGYLTKIPKYHPGQHQYVPDSLVDLNDAGTPQYVRAVKCQYASGGDSTTVYHIFARIPTQNG